jgi:hypothetical protein
LSTLMYHENRKSKNAFVGCQHNCVYCKPSFQRQARRFEGKGYDFQPRYHPERLLKSPPRTGEGEFIFFPSMGDLAFATPTTVQAHIEYARKYADRTFLIQSKNPKWFHDYAFPENVILGTTIETNLVVFDTPSKYRYYSEISEAPYPVSRFSLTCGLGHKRKSVTIEPILDFVLSVMIEWMKKIQPETIWVGYDNHGCFLPEPALDKTMSLIDELKKRGFNVRTKTLRKAWYEA